MRKIAFIFLLSMFINNYSYSQSSISILEKVGGQLIQDLSGSNEWKSIGKAIETVGDMTYEIERIEASNRHEIIIKRSPDNITRIYPSEGYKWKNPNDKNDYTTVSITDNDIRSQQSANELLQKSYKYFNSGELEKAIFYCNESLSEEESVKSYFLRSMIYYKKDLPTLALNDLGNALNFELDNETYNLIYYFKALYLVGLEQYNEAILACNYVMDSQFMSNEDKSFLLFIRAGAKYQLEKYESACSDLNMAIDEMNKIRDMDTDDKSILSYALALRACIYGDRKEYRMAINDSNGAIKLDGSNSLAYALRGFAKIELGFIDSGCSDLKKAQKMSTDYVELYHTYCE